MNPERIVELVTDAVTDAVRERLPDLIRQHAEALLAPALLRLAAAELALANVGAKATPQEALEPLRESIRALEKAATLVPDLVRTEISTAAADFGKRLGALDAALADAAAKAAPADALGSLTAAVAGLDLRLTAFRAEQESVSREQISAEVRAAVAALALPAGPPGEPGAPGRDGKDGAEPKIAPPVQWTAGIRYARGSLLQHRGGLWFANVETSVEPGEPLSGCALVVDGCEPIRCEADEAGALSLVFRYASGIEKAIALGFRPFAYCGVYDEARQYMPNDLVTCEGSMWIARRDALGTRPGTEAGALIWTLVVKRGKDGRDGPAGPRGERGEAGAAGAPASKRKAASNGASQ